QGDLFNILITYEDENGQKEVQLNVRDFESLFDFSGDTSSVAFDFFLISSISYGIDDLFARSNYSFNGWTREFEVEFPVNNVEAWSDVKSQLSGALSFLTGDLWEVSFKPIESQVFLERTNRRQSAIPIYEYDDYSFASLFSGGLDSLIGVINQLENLSPNKKGILISHSDGDYPGPQTDQFRVSSKLREAYPEKFVNISCRIGLSNRNTIGESFSRDGNQRSRSILFLGIASYLVHQLPNLNELILPENGTISLNHPLTPSRSSSLSTRTTHPFFIDRLQNIFAQVGIDVLIRNPFSFHTKGEMVAQCLNSTVLAQTYMESVSCGKRGHKVHWDIRNAKQCGVCMPCIYRRAALNKLDLDNEIYGKDLLNSHDPENLARQDLSALFDYLKSPLTIDTIKR
ncbi:MAG: Qat anti-phage system QueC-like protein QatC, partial [Bacteroidota bacterium]